MTVRELRELIIECLLESNGDLVGRIPLDVLKKRSVPSPVKIKLGGFKKETEDPVLQKELNSLNQRHSQHLDIKTFGFTDFIRLQTLNASEEAPKGTGSSYMRDLTRLADAKGLPIVLTPSIEGSFGGSGFKQTTGYERLVKFYKQFGFKDRTESPLPDSLKGIPDIMYRLPEGLNERNKKVDNYRYYGFTDKDEDAINDKIEHYHTSHDGLEKERIKNYFETLYQYVVGRNPVLKDIDVYQRDYQGKDTARMALVYGAVSGIPPEDIKDYIEVTKGLGGLHVPSGYQIDTSAKRHIRLKKVD